MLEPDSKHRSGRRHWPPIVTGITFVALYFAGRWTCTADELRASFLGRPLGTDCAFRLRFGIPCPNCGLTRAVIMAAHGEWLRAWRVTPSGPAVVLATLVCAAVLIALGVVRMRASARVATHAERLAPRAVYVCAAVLLIVWLGGWVAAVAHALAAR